MNKLIDYLTTSTRLRAVGFSTLLFLLLLPVAPAAALASTGVVKVCPPADETANVDLLLGQIWGYTDRYGKYVALGGFFLLLILLPTKVGKGILVAIAAISAALVLASIVVGAIENLPGTC